MIKTVFDRYAELTKNEICNAEKILNVKFPALFKYMIQRYSGGRFKENNYIQFEDNLDIEVYEFLEFDLDKVDNFIYWNSEEFDGYIDGIVYFARTTTDGWIAFDYRENLDTPSIVTTFHDEIQYLEDELVFLAKDFNTFMNMLTPNPEPYDDDYRWPDEL